MVEPLMEEAVAAAAAAATATGEGCFADELVLLDFTSDIYPPPLAAAATAGELQHQAFFLEDLFDPSVDCLAGLPAGGDEEEEEEEELEWLANKDAFPELETSFEVPVRSLSSSGRGWSGNRGGAAAASVVVAERASAVSPLAAAASFSAPARPRSKGRTRRRMVLAPLSSPHLATAAGARKRGAQQRRRCRHCQAEETPQWRAGPEGPKTLCNACGVRYKSGRLVPEYRPASSPTFSAAIHSNSHRQILEMRRQKPSGERGGTGPPPRPLS